MKMLSPDLSSTSTGAILVGPDYELLEISFKSRSSSRWTPSLYSQIGRVAYSPFVISREVFFEWCAPHVLTDEDRGST